MEEQALVRAEKITKQFPGVVALKEVSFDVRRGEILSIVGENGAGKSTLMNILSGVYQPSSGCVWFEGRPVNFRDPLDAQRSGIAMIHQELSVAPKLSVMENIFIGRLFKNKLGFVDYSRMRRECEKQLAALGNRNIRPEQMVWELSTSQRQVVEIAKALSLQAKLIIMDEPTSSLSKGETEALLKTIVSLSRSGVAVLFISHKMDEVFEISDRITVFRDGEHIRTLENKEASPDEIISLMVGRTVIRSYQRTHKTFGTEDTPLLEVKGLRGKKLRNIDFRLYRGEVLALTGLVGAGRTELLQSIFGLDALESGEIFLENKKVTIRGAADARRLGLGLVPEGRKLTGLFMNMSVMENETLCILGEVSKAGVIDDRADKKRAGEISKQLAVKTPSLEQKVKFLSGGNQQKCIIGRWLMTNPKILFLDEPTHGIDVGAKAEIYQIIDDLAKNGVSVLLASSELPEVLTLADRILVMRQGEIVAELPGEGATQERIMQHAVIRNTAVL